MTSLRFAGRLILLAVLAESMAEGYSCSRLPVPCEAVGAAPFVFAGTLTRVVRTKGTNIQSYWMRVDRAYKGNLREVVKLIDIGMQSGPKWKIGSQYLVYTGGLSPEELTFPVCGWGRPVEEAQADLAFLKEYSAGRTVTRVSGVVGFEPETLWREGVRVVLTMGSQRYEQTVGAKGEFTFVGLAAGSYRVDAMLAGFRAMAVVGDVEASSGACTVAHVSMYLDHRVEGVVRNRDGTPAAGVMVELSPVHPHPNWSENSFYEGATDASGRYVIDYIATGEYYVGINIAHAPMRLNPYPRTYAESPVVFSDEAQGWRRDLIAPERLRLVTFRGRIVAGKGRSQAEFPIITILDKGLLGWLMRQDPIPVGADGRFSVELCEGVRYVFEASETGGVRSRRSAPLEIVAAGGQVGEQVFVLDRK